MTRGQFLDQLRRGLSGVTPEDVNDVLADYNAHFDEGTAQGRSEDEIAEKLGDPSRLARELRAEIHVRAWERRPTPASFFAVLFAFIGLAALDFVVMLPLLGWVALFVLVICAVSIGLVIGGIIAVLSAFHVGLVFTPHAGAARLFTGLFLGGIGVALGASLLLFARWVVDLLVKFARLHYKLLKRADPETR